MSTFPQALSNCHFIAVEKFQHSWLTTIVSRTHMHKSQIQHFMLSIADEFHLGAPFSRLWLINAISRAAFIAVNSRYYQEATSHNVICTSHTPRAHLNMPYASSRICIQETCAMHAEHYFHICAVCIIVLMTRFNEYFSTQPKEGLKAIIQMLTCIQLLLNSNKITAVI